MVILASQFFRTSLNKEAIILGILELSFTSHLSHLTKLQVGYFIFFDIDRRILSSVALIGSQGQNKACIMVPGLRDLLWPQVAVAKQLLVNTPIDRHIRPGHPTVSQSSPITLAGHKSPTIILFCNPVVGQWKRIPLTSFFSTNGRDRQSIRLGSVLPWGTEWEAKKWISCGSSEPVLMPSKASRTQSSQFPRTAAVMEIASSNSKGHLFQAPKQNVP